MVRDGMFHGEGTIMYPMGQKFEGVWSKGDVIDFKYNFCDGLEYATPWNYCQMPDRRFYKCKDGLRPAGRSLLMNENPCRRIPKGCYDTADGYYNPNSKCVMSAFSPGKIIRIPTRAEELWIKQNCRKAWDEPVGYRPDLYEHWVTGRRSGSIFIVTKEFTASTNEITETDDSSTSDCHRIYDEFTRDPQSVFENIN
ncbi:hypothetical protein FQR65_LT12922 [Abscondita terminalis]|nr:hypothetical protein FQR65_LT12922 [Abscondita terminalis]